MTTTEELLKESEAVISSTPVNKKSNSAIRIARINLWLNVLFIVLHFAFLIFALFLFIVYIVPPIVHFSVTIFGSVYSSILADSTPIVILVPDQNNRTIQILSFLTLSFIIIMVLNSSRDTRRMFNEFVNIFTTAPLRYYIDNLHYCDWPIDTGIPRTSRARELRNKKEVYY